MSVPDSHIQDLMKKLKSIQKLAKLTYRLKCILFVNMNMLEYFGVDLGICCNLDYSLPLESDKEGAS